MKWITEISIDNYRAFGKKETINITEGNHLLIYGENGSGKSSIYNALKDFFASSFTNSGIHFKLNEFQEIAQNHFGNIIVKISENGKESDYKFSIPIATNHNQIPEIQLANKIKGFLDYKKMLQVHSLNIPDNEQPNLFNLIFKDLLSDYLIPNPKGGVTEVELFKEYNSISEILLTKRSNAHEFINAKNDLLNLRKSLNTPLENIFKRVNDYLAKYFKNKLTIKPIIGSFGLTKESPIKTRKMRERFFLSIEYANTKIDYYQAFLNEARLSSLAICIYLSAIKEYSLKAPPDTLKVLYLDDVFIGLDTSNRFPLLEIIKEEFIKEDFQFFISTYDREWFELSRHWFSTKNIKIKALELFIEDNENIPLTPDYPVIIPSKGNFAKAKAYFKAKDYTASGNYLRKECEDLISKILPKTYKINEDCSKVQELENLLKKLEKLFEDCNIPKPKELLDSLKIYRKALLNPSSHNDLKSPIFRKELEEAFKIVGNLEKLYESEIVQTLIKLFDDKTIPKFALEQWQICHYKNIPNNYDAEIELVNSLFVIEINKQKKFTSHKFKLKKWTFNGVDYQHEGKVLNNKQIEYICKQERTLEEIFVGINQSTKIPIPVNLNSEIIIGAGQTLNDFLL